MFNYDKKESVMMMSENKIQGSSSKKRKKELRYDEYPKKSRSCFDSALCRTLTCGLWSNRKNYVKLPTTSKNNETSVSDDNLSSEFKQFIVSCIITFVRITLIIISHIIIMGYWKSPHDSQYHGVLNQFSYYVIHLCFHVSFEYFVYEYINHSSDTKVIEIQKIFYEKNIGKLSENNRDEHTVAGSNVYFKGLDIKKYEKNSDGNRDKIKIKGDDDYVTSDTEEDQNFILPTYSTINDNEVFTSSNTMKKRNIFNEKKSEHDNNNISAVLHQQQRNTLRERPSKRMGPTIVVMRKQLTEKVVRIKKILNDPFRYFNYVWIVGSFIAFLVHVIGYLIVHQGTFMMSFIQSTSFASKHQTNSHHQFLISWQLEVYMGFFYIISDVLMKITLYYLYISSALDASGRLFRVNSIWDIFSSNNTFPDDIEEYDESYVNEVYDKPIPDEMRQNSYDTSNINGDSFVYPTSSSFLNRDNGSFGSMGIGFKQSILFPTTNTSPSSPSFQSGSMSKIDDERERYEIAETEQCRRQTHQLNLSNRNEPPKHVLVDSYSWLKCSLFFLILKIQFIYFRLIPRKMMFMIIRIISMIIIGIYFGQRVVVTTVTTPIHMLRSPSADASIPHAFTANNKKNYPTMTFSQKIQLNVIQTNLLQCQVRYTNRPWLTRRQCKKEADSLHTNQRYSDNTNTNHNHHLSILFKMYVTHIVSRDWSDDNTMDNEEESKKSGAYRPFRLRTTTSSPLFNNLFHRDDHWKSTEIGHDAFYTHRYFKLIQENLLNGNIIDENMTWKDKMTLYQWINELHHSYFYGHAMNHFYVNSIGAFLIIMIVSIFYDICNEISIDTLSSSNDGNSSKSNAGSIQRSYSNETCIGMDGNGNGNGGGDDELNKSKHLLNQNNRKYKSVTAPKANRAELNTRLYGKSNNFAKHSFVEQGTIDRVAEDDIGLWNISNYYSYLVLPNFFLTWYSIWDIILYLGALLIVYTILLFYRASKRSIKNNSF